MTGCPLDLTGLWFMLQDLQSKPVDRLMHLLQQFDRLVSGVGVVLICGIFLCVC